MRLFSRRSRIISSRASSEEMIRLLRENNRIQEARLVQVDTHVIQVDTRVMHADARVAQLNAEIREQHLQTERILTGLAESQQALTTEMQEVKAHLRGTSTELRALIRLIESIIRGRNNGDPPV